MASTPEENDRARAELFHKQMITTLKINTMHLPIKTLGGIRLNNQGLMIRMQKVTAETADVFTIHFEAFARYKDEQVLIKRVPFIRGETPSPENSFTEIIRKISNGKYCKMRNLVLTDDVLKSNATMDKLVTDLTAIMTEGSKGNVESTECCVCYELCEMSLRCGHCICLECESKLTGETKCPMCRAEYTRCACCDETCECFDD